LPAERHGGVTGISVIVSTYNHPNYLDLALRGFAVQTDADFELVVADDGSGSETAAVVSRAREETALRLVHVWHEDRGFRKSEILNRAIMAASGDYLIFTDGDCVPRNDLVEMHRSLARPGRYIAGGYLKLSAEVSGRVTREDVTNGRVTDLKWLRDQGWRPGRRAIRLTSSRLVGSIMDYLTPTAADFQGNNASTWRSALVEVNGFDSEMGYGGLDQALGYRLQNAGVRGIQARHRAVTMHLHHERPYRDPRVVQQNRAIKSRIRSNGETRARSGLAEVKSDSTLRVETGPTYVRERDQSIRRTPELQLPR
jgi:glycosyltransferase involved in cell wall biosynthesis